MKTEMSKHIEWMIETLWGQLRDDPLTAWPYQMSFARDRTTIRTTLLNLHLKNGYFLSTRL